MLSSKVVAESRPTETASYTHKRHLSARPSSMHSQICQAATHLTNSKMAETADELLFVKSVGSLLHAADDGHRPVPLEQVLLRHLNVEAGSLRPVPAEGVFMEPHRERLGVGRVLVQLRCVGGGLDRPREGLQ